ncbi:MAG: hypothetical protein ACYC2Y_10740 [Armatimonadota bacterium]
MKKWFLLMTALACLASAAVAQDAVKLAYKFTPGEVLRYQVTGDMAMTMTGVPMELPAMNMYMVMREEVKKVLDNGDAQVSVTYESAKMAMGGEWQDVPTANLPAMTMVMSPTGAVRDVKGADSALSMGGMPSLDMNGMMQMGGALPANALRAGDTWTITVPVPMAKSGEVKVDGTLVNTSTKVGEAVTAEFKQKMSGSFVMDVPAGPSSPAITMNATLNGNMDNYFSVERGLLILSKGIVKMHTTAPIPGADTTIDVDMNMNIQTYLLP